MDTLNDTPFYLENGRAMISLGPISKNRHCPFRCPFCYVESSSFIKYANWDIKQTLDWLKANLELIDIIYVSGDTDSFAPPRTELGLNLLEEISHLEKDILFTTRHVFEDEKNYLSLETISQNLKRNGNLAIGCTSVCQITQPHLEPKPIKEPLRRIQQLGKFKELGWIPILAMRPIMPGVPATDFSSIMEFASVHTDLCLISAYLYDPNSNQLKPTNPAKPLGKIFFDIGNSSDWQKIDPTPDVIKSIQNAAIQFNMKIFDQSSVLYSYLKQKKML